MFAVDSQAPLRSIGKFLRMHTSQDTLNVWLLDQNAIEVVQERFDTSQKLSRTIIYMYVDRKNAFKVAIELRRILSCDK